jgi:demethylmenaquinone methyltransferase/2-methoxy-6-polyprenyl-1,4-benzoquinol methylase
VFEYYEQRAPEYDEWYLGTGLFASQERPGWLEELRTLCELIAALDQSDAMTRIAEERLPDATVVRAQALPLPFPDAAFDRIFTGHFYGHLREDERRQFLTEAGRVAHELVVVDSHERPDRGVEEEQERVLNDGSVHRVYKRYFTGEGLAAELGGGEVRHDGRWFVMVRTGRPV